MRAATLKVSFVAAEEQLINRKLCGTGRGEPAAETVCLAGE